MAYLVTSLSPTKAIAIDDVGGGVTYIGLAKVGTDTGEEKWQIRRLTKTGTETLSEFADSDDRYDNEWDNRASLVYG